VHRCKHPRYLVREARDRPRFHSAPSALSRSPSNKLPDPLVRSNPLNGQEIKIPARPATKVPRFTFSKTFKELALKAKVKK